jgi:Fe-S-cluster-containing dehydrogenase component
VGKDQVLMHRQMHWIRIDRYFKGKAEDSALDVVFQPMMCVHCENAPCEQVCPVAATVHDTEGLNTMVYNRCIGTRYCSNNCPYKVRRFNYFDFHAKDPKQKWAAPWPGMPDAQQQAEIDKLRRLQFNPEVTVRMRGVMEKCTYCTHRLSRTKIDKRNAGQEVKDGDVMTACQQACPTQAITFGNLNEKGAAVSQLHRNPRAFDVLGELNTRPRTKYLAKLRNPAPQAGAVEHHSSGAGLMGIENSAETIG